MKVPNLRFDNFASAKRLKSFTFAFSGIAHALKTQANMRIHVLISAAVIVAAWYFHVSRADWLWLVFAIMIVLSAELMNSAFEYLCDVVSPEHSLAVAKAKDIAAGAVLVVAIGAVAIGAMVFWPNVF